MKERIAQIMQIENMTAIQFAKKIGINPSSLSHILSGRNNASLDIVMKIHKGCKNINLNWLLFGEGEMLESSSEDFPSDNGDIPGENRKIAYTSHDLFEYRKENASELPVNASKEIVKQEIKYVEKPTRKITEIRIFFDNGTYETFKPDNG